MARARARARANDITYVVCLGVEPLVVGGDECRLYLAVCGDAVGLRAEREERGGIAPTGELELRQVVDEEVECGGYGAKAVLDVPAGKRRCC